MFKSSFGSESANAEQIINIAKIAASEEFKCECANLSKNQASAGAYFDLLAEKSGVEYGKLTKPNGDGTVSDYVIFSFATEQTVEECVNTVLENYKNGSLTEAELVSALSSPHKAESKNIVEYNYGRYFMYDSANGKCVRTSDIVHKYKNGTNE